MVFLGESKPLAVARKLQKLYYLTPRDGEKFDAILVVKHISVFIFACSPTIAGLVGFICNASVDSMAEQLMETISDLLICAIFAILAFTHLAFGNKTAKLMDRIQKITDDTPEEMSKIYIKIDKITWYIYIFGLFTIAYSASRKFYKNHCLEITIDDGRYVCYLINPTWFPFVLDDFVVAKFIFIAWYDLGQMFIMPLYTVTVVVMVSMPCFIVARLQHLKRSLREANLENFTKNFAYYVRYYSEICGCVKDMNNTIGYCLLCQYVLAPVFMSMLGCLTIKWGNELGANTLPIVVLMEWLLCANGQSLEDEQEKLLQELHSVPWYEMSEPMKLNFYLFVVQLRAPLQLQVKSLIVANHQFFLSIYRAVYSIVAFLVNSSKD